MRRLLLDGFFAGCGVAIGSFGCFWYMGHSDRIARLEIDRDTLWMREKELRKEIDAVKAAEVRHAEELRDTIGLVLRAHEDAKRRAHMARMGMPHVEAIPPQDLPIPKWVKPVAGEPPAVTPKVEMIPMPRLVPECCH